MAALMQIPNLPVAIALNGTEQFEAVQAGVSVRVSAALLAAYAQGTAIPELTFSAPLVRTLNNVALAIVPVTLGGTGAADAPQASVNLSTTYVVSTLDDLTALTVQPPVVEIATGRGSGNPWVFRPGDQSANVTADPLKGLWAAPDSEPTGASGAWQRIYDGPIMVAWFGTDWTALKAAVDTNVGDTIILTAGETYTYTDLAQTITIVDRTINIVGPYSTLAFRKTNAIGFHASASWHDVQAVSVIATPTTTPVLTVADGTVYAAGAWIKIGSDQPLPETPSANNVRMGEWAVVKEVTSTTVTLSGPLYYTYDVLENVKIGAIDTEYTFTADIGVVDLVNIETDTVVRVESLGTAPKVRIGSIPFLKGAGINDISCLDGDYYIGHIGAGDYDNSYGIVFASSKNGNARIGFSGAMRHAIDHGHPLAIPDANGMGIYGAAETCRGYDSYSEGGIHTPYASHQATRDCLYENCTSREGAAGCVAFRGTGNRALRCTSIGAVAGSASFAAFRHNGGTGIYADVITNNTTFEDCMALDSQGAFFGSDDCGSVKFIGGLYEQSSLGVNDEMFSVGGYTINSGATTFGGEISFHNVRVRLNGSVSRPMLRTYDLTTRVDLGNLDVYMGMSSSLPRILDNTTSAPFVLTWEDMRVDNPNGTLQGIHGTTTILTAGSRYGNFSATGNVGTTLFTGVNFSQYSPYMTGEFHMLTGRLRYQNSLTLVDMTIPNPSAADTITAQSDGIIRRYSNGAAHTLAPSAENGFSYFKISNISTAGVITVSGFTKVTGSFATTNNNIYFVTATTIDGTSHLEIVLVSP
jgi:hypothetical protein